MNGSKNYKTTNYVRPQTKDDRESSCYNCPYRSKNYGMKCFPCTRQILGEHIPELEGERKNEH